MGKELYKVIHPTIDTKVVVSNTDIIITKNNNGDIVDITLPDTADNKEAMFASFDYCRIIRSKE